MPDQQRASARIKLEQRPSQRRPDRKIEGARTSRARLPEAPFQASPRTRWNPGDGRPVSSTWTGPPVPATKRVRSMIGGRHGKGARNAARPSCVDAPQPDLVVSDTRRSSRCRNHAFACMGDIATRSPRRAEDRQDAMSAPRGTRRTYRRPTSRARPHRPINCCGKFRTPSRETIGRQKPPVVGTGIDGRQIRASSNTSLDDAQIERAMSDVMTATTASHTNPHRRGLDHGEFA